MKLIKANKVVYEAFGQSHILYTKSNYLDYIERVLKTIVPTAHFHISQFEQVEITTTEYKEKSIVNAEKWCKAIESSYPEDFDITDIQDAEY